MILVTFETRDKTCSKIEKPVSLGGNPVDTRHCFNVNTTSRRRIDVETASSVYCEKAIKRIENQEAVVQGCSVKKEFLKILQNSQENTRAGITL